MQIAKELGPRKQAVKTLEMTVRRALAIIEVFDNLPEGARDWSDADPKDLRNAMGDIRFDPTQAIWPELWTRYKSGLLHTQTRALVENLDLDSLSKKAKKEIEDGIARIS